MVTHGFKQFFGRRLASLCLSLILLGAAAGCHFGGAGQPKPKKRSAMPEWPFILPSPQNVRYGGLLPDRGWSWNAAGLSENLAAAVKDVCGPPVPGGRSIQLALTSEVTHPQGYRLYITDTGVCILANSEIGFFYGLQSLRALCAVKDGVRVVRQAQIDDWPEFETRGVITYAPLAKYMPAMKFNLLQVPSGWGDFDHEAYRSLVAESGRRYTRFLAQVGSKGRFWKRNEMLNFKKDGYRKLKEYYRSLYDLGVREFSVDFDDMPLKPGQGEALGKKHAEACGVVYDWLKALDPKGFIVFCPVPYGGPGPNGGFVNSSFEEGDKYLQTIGKRLPAEAQVYWTGPWIYSAQVDNTQTDECAARIGRKPLFWDNETLPWLKQMRPLNSRPGDFADHVSGYVANMADPPDSFNPALLPVVLSVSDYLWNPQAYNPEISLQRALCSVAGPKYPEVSEAWAAAQTACASMFKAKALGQAKRAPQSGSAPASRPVYIPRFDAQDAERYEKHWKAAIAKCANQEFAQAFIKRLDEMAKMPQPYIK